MSRPLSVKPEQWSGARPLECFKRNRFGTADTATLSLGGDTQPWHEHSRHQQWGLAPSKREQSARTRWTETVDTPKGAISFRNTVPESQSITVKRITELINSDSCLSINSPDRQHYTA